MKPNQTKEKVLFVLDVLRRSRSRLIEDFLTESPDLYHPMFKYENDEAQLLISIEKYFIIWIDKHWEILNQKYQEEGCGEISQDMLEHFFFKSLLIFLKQLNYHGKEYHSLSKTLIMGKIKLLSEIAKFGDKHHAKAKLISYWHDKDRALFERLMKDLGGKNELVDDNYGS